MFIPNFAFRYLYLFDMFFSQFPYSSNLRLVTDSRLITSPENSLFFAIRGERHNGHQFIKELYQKGVRKFVVETNALTSAERAEYETWEDAYFYEVANPVETLQDLATQHRARFDLPVIGVTGSNGKTIVKEWLAQLLSGARQVVASPKSYNSQIGVPLSVWNIRPEHNLGIFEAGISRPFEMTSLQAIIEPSIGIFTNVGGAHDEGFKSKKQKISEKLKLFVKSEKLIFRSDYPEITSEIDLILKPVNPSLQLVSWATHSDATIAVSFAIHGTQTTISLASPKGNFSFIVPFFDEASLENITHCIVCLLTLAIAPSYIQEHLSKLRAVSMRLELKEGIFNTYLIDDTYNSDLQGLSMALGFLNRQNQRPRKAVILSDILQSGLKSEELFPAIAELIKSAEVDTFIGIGPELTKHKDLIDFENSYYYLTTQDFLDFHLGSSLANSTLLIKGARPFGFERIVDRLQQKTHNTVLEINLDAITHNLNFYKGLVGNQTKIMAMVKAFAYGSGSAEIAATLQFNRVDYLGVAYPDEGISLRQSGITLPIMVMNAMPNTYEALQRFDLEPEIFSRKSLLDWLSFSRQSRSDVPSIHLKLDTGMHRLGFVENDYSWLKQMLSENPSLKIASIFSHLVGADEGKHTPYTHEQHARFRKGAEFLETEIGHPVLKHLLNSAGIVRFPEYKLDMVRLGIGLYGIEATGEQQRHLQTVGTLKATISQIKSIPAGETIGYGRHGIVDKPSEIATISIGYADGYDRRFGNGKGKIMVNGVACPTVGNVCMDMTMIDISETQAEEGDTVVVMGEQLPAWQMAKDIGTIPYELFTNIGERVKRVFYKD
jgi:alanine racemase